MRSRFRFLAALFALLALTVTAVEGAWAAVCPVEMEMSADRATSVEANASSEACMHGVAVMHRGTAPSQDAGAPDAPRCPSMPAGTAGSCTGAAALPAEATLQPEPSTEGALLAISSENRRDLLLAAAFFRPPIA
jgi:hypothetical protein